MSQSRNQMEFQAKIQEQMEIFGYDALILTSAESIFYASGYCSRSIYNNGALGGAIAIVPKTGRVIVVCSQFEQKAAAVECPDIEVISYPIWLYIADFPDEGEKPVQPDPNKAFTLGVKALMEVQPTAKHIGVDAASLTYLRMEFLSSIFGRENIEDCSKLLIKARELKTEWEIEVLRENSQLAEIQMTNTARQIEVGMTEEDIMHYFSIAGFNLSKEVHGIRQAHTYSEYYATAFIPRTHPMVDGDIVRLDGGVIRKGYSSDLGRSFVVGQSLADERREIYDLLLTAFDKGMEMIGPGVKPSDVFKAMLAIVQKKIPAFKRGHFGHSLGCIRGEEYPFIAPNNDSPFRPGMIFCVEAPYYSSAQGSYNVEDTLLITENGYERFTHANRSLFWPDR